jgi:uncharacterized UBP type Zn finger protein
VPAACEHIPADLNPPDLETPEGCTDCIAADRTDWVHLRFCQECGHVGCCDNSPGRHATGHARQAGHPLIRSYEPSEDWWYCYPDDAMFLLAEAPPAPSHD